MNESEDREIRIKRLKYRANHRGIKEMDIVLGGFANRHLDQLGESQVEDFEKLLDEHDRDLLMWVTGEMEFPVQDLQEIFDQVVRYATDHHQKSH